MKKKVSGWATPGFVDTKLKVTNPTFGTKKQGHSTFSSLAGPCLCCVCPSIRYSFHSLLSVSEGRPVFPIVRAFNEGSPRPRVARAQKIIRLHHILCSWSTGPTWVFSRSASFLYLSLGEWPSCPRLRASDEHILIVRVLRARRAPGRFLVFLDLSPPVS